MRLYLKGKSKNYFFSFFILATLQWASCIAVYAQPPACSTTFPFNATTQACEINISTNACDAGNGGTSNASAVSANVVGASPAEKFTQVVNKKLACCLNEFGSVGQNVKFDCIQSKKVFSDFNELWSAADPIVDGGQINAMIMTDANGNPITGFYGLGGGRCSDFSEFAGELVPAKVAPLPSSNEVNHSQGGLTDSGVNFLSDQEIPLPGTNATSNKAGGYTPSSSYSPNYDTIKKHMIALGKTIPYSYSRTTQQNFANMQRCPILVRAAVLPTCPSLLGGGSQKTVAVNSGGIDELRCSAAVNVQIHLRIEQLYEFNNTPKAKPFDTILDQRLVASISLAQYISTKFGSTCPAGTTRQGDACVY